MPGEIQARLTELMRRGGADREFVFRYIDEEFGDLFRKEEDGKAFMLFINGVGNMGETEQQSIEFVRLLFKKFYLDLPQPAQRTLRRACQDCDFDPVKEAEERATGRLAINTFKEGLQKRFEVKKAEAGPDSKLLAAALYAGGDRADSAIAFLTGQMSEIFRHGGDNAVELFSDWMDILIEGNPDSARKFCATVLPMLPAKTRKQALARHGIESDSTFQDDPLLESLITRIVIGGREGATAITNVFNAVEQVKGSREAETVISELRATLSPEIIASIRPYLTERIRSIVG